MITQRRLETALPKTSLMLAQLKKVSLFSHLGDDTLLCLLAKMSLKRWHGGAIIVGQNEPGDALYILVSGQAKVVVFGENGREMVLSTLAPGDFFGEMSLVTGRVRSANIMAQKDTTLLVLEREAFFTHLRSHPETLMRLARVMAERLGRADQMITNLALFDVTSRLTRTLIDLAQANGEEQSEGILIRRRPTQQDLANMVGTCRETVSRALSSLARRGLVVSRGRSILLSRELVERKRFAA
jgi:CRP/FNR family transcriptional regulator, cyclic AMP receptor protein